MYAIIETGGKQYRVAQGDVLDVEIDATDDDGAVRFDRVLLVGGDEGVTLGSPLVENAAVDGEAIAEVRGSKVVVFKKKRRKGYKRRQGHRQNLLRVRIGGISVG